MSIELLDYLFTVIFIHYACWYILLEVASLEASIADEQAFLQGRTCFLRYK